MQKEESLAIKTIGILGAGTMGSGIAQLAARHGFSVIMSDLRQEFLDRAINSIVSGLQHDIEKARLMEVDKKRVMDRIRTTVSLDPLRDADLIIEAVNESRELKAELFSNLDSLLPPEVILASNTSSLSITRLAAATARPDRVIGMHFMHPVTVMKLVEVIRGLATSDETFQTVKRLAEALGKIPIEANDAPGFVSNRILMPMINEAIFALYEGVGTAEAIDEIMKLGMRHPMGPLQLADFIGLDVCLAIMNVLYEGFNDPKYRPCPLLKKYVDAGWLGCKSGKGFYKY